MIGYYIHHHGSGHLQRAGTLAAATDEPVVGISSLPEPSGDHPFANWIRLAPDPRRPEASEVTAGASLHWSPLNSPEYALRMAQVTRWVTTARPRTVVVDVSVEVTALIRLLGVPVVVVALPGNRLDAAHTTGFRMATSIIAPWSGDIYRPAFLEPFADKTVYTGAISRFDRVARPSEYERETLLVLLGSGGSAVGKAFVRDLRAATGWRVHGIGGELGWTDDVLQLLSYTHVVLAHGGLNALSEVAAIGRPCVILPQRRPFDEQHVTARALHAAGIALDASQRRTHGSWPSVLEAVVQLGGRDWARWNDGSGADRFASALQTAGAA